MASEVVHQYTKTVVVRVVSRVYDDGELTRWVAVEADVPTMDELLGVLTRAQHHIINGGGALCDQVDLKNMPEVVIEGEDDDGE